MKQATQHSFSPISKAALEALTMQENETIVIGAINNDKAFSNIDLWNIHRQRKEIKNRRLNSSSLTF